MNYPQQPGHNDPWGQQPAQPNPYGQPGGQYPQSGQQPAWGQQPGGPQQPWDQQQAWGQQQQQAWAQQQQQPWGQQPGQPWPQQAYPGQQHPYGQPGAPPPTGNKSKLPWILGGTGGGILVIGAITALIVGLSSGPGDPEETARKYVDSFNEKNASRIANLSCSKSGKNPLEQGMSQYGASGIDTSELLDKMQFDVSLENVTRESDERAVAEISGEATMELTALGETRSQSIPMDLSVNMTVEDGSWKMCGMQESGPTGSTG
ncbi:hypothetical protein FHR84_000399 [Actinopolyspora biskrensis]|uniref:DUF4878 domain-containing protein n=1 Tax=Actinopolyspora biskrensis TaxID=1470178 RepID=A0A852YW28_9ACTN|nr:hypothetical protein [Actinopolyspora biskrensis]NYH77085.1 hypothetical protein [Actinopolyspora biskrensis]